MIKGKKKDEAEILAEVVVKGMQDKKANDISVIDLRKIDNSISKFFIICHGNSNTHVDSISESVEEHVEQIFNFSPWHREGRNNAEWILLDYSDVVVHIFMEHKRNFYRLEELWADADIKRIPNLD